MASVKKSVTIDEELERKLQEFREKFGSTDSGIISIALKEYFEKFKRDGKK